MFESFNKNLQNDISTTELVFDDMNLAVDLYQLKTDNFERELHLANLKIGELLEHVITNDVTYIVHNALSPDAMILNANVVTTCDKCLELEAELSDKHKIFKEQYNKLAMSHDNLEKNLHFLELEKQESERIKSFIALADHNDPETIDYVRQIKKLKV